MFKATFRGKHNIQKSRLLIVLFLLEGDGITEITCQKLCQILDGLVKPTYLSRRLPQLYRWHYLNRTQSKTLYYKPFVYSLAARGNFFVTEVIPEALFCKIVSELKPRIEAWQDKNKSGKKT